MNPLLLLLALVWSSCLLTVIVAAVLYINADKVQDGLDTLLTPAAIKSMEHINDNAHQTVDQLSKSYLQDVKRLFQHRSRRQPNDTQE